MPRVYRKRRNRGGTKTYVCNKCREEVMPFEEYFTWKFRHGSPVYRHVKCGAPGRGELTMSKMGTVYTAVDDFDVSSAQSVEDIEAALASVAEAAREVATEYGDSADNMEQAFSSSPTGDACRATQEALDAWADELEGWSPSSDSPDEIGSDSPDDVGDVMEEWLDGLRSEAQDIVNEAPEYQG